MVTDKHPAKSPIRVIGWVLPLLTLVTVIWLNVVEHPTGEGSIAFNSGVKGAFSHVRGWPFRAFARANEDAAGLVRASVVQGNTHIRRDVYVGAYPHLARNTFLAIANLTIAGSLLCIAVLIAIAFQRIYSLYSGDA